MHSGYTKSERREDPGKGYLLWGFGKSGKRIGGGPGMGISETPFPLEPIKCIALVFGIVPDSGGPDAEMSPILLCRFFLVSSSFITPHFDSRDSCFA